MCIQPNKESLFNMNKATVDNTIYLQPGNQHTCNVDRPLTLQSQLWQSYQCHGDKAQRQKEKNGVIGCTKCGVYTPNNRCRPEAPLTSLPKLTPAKNAEGNGRVGEEEKGRTTQDKNQKRQRQRDGGQSKDMAE